MTSGVGDAAEGGKALAYQARVGSKLDWLDWYVLPWGRQEKCQDSPADWPQRPTFTGWAGAEEIARHYGEGSRLDE